MRKGFYGLPEGGGGHWHKCGAEREPHSHARRRRILTQAPESAGPRVYRLYQQEKPGRSMPAEPE